MSQIQKKKVSQVAKRSLVLDVNSCQVALTLDNGVHETRIKSYLCNPTPGINSPYKEQPKVSH